MTKAITSAKTAAAKAGTLAFAAALTLLGQPGIALAATAKVSDGGKLADGRASQVITLTAANGVNARILTYGATLQAFNVPDRHGKPGDIVLGHDTAADYEAAHDYLGATVGRYANRIAHGTFTLDGRTYTLPRNNGANSLHGGGDGFDRQEWQIAGVVGKGRSASVELRHVSPDGALGYPGTLSTTVVYALADDGKLTITMTATTDKPTVVNITNHALFNMAGDGSGRDAMSQILTVPASRYTPVDATLIPTGELAPVTGTVFDFRKGRRIADGLRDGTDAQIRIGRGYDHNLAIDAGQTARPKLIARLADPVSGRMLSVLSTEPGLQFYTGNFLDGTVPGKGRRLYRMGDGIALEPQHFPDGPNQPAFPSTRLDPGQTYRHVMILSPSVTK